MIDFEFACRDDCLDKLVPSDLRRLVAENEELKRLVVRVFTGRQTAEDVAQCIFLQHSETQ